MIGDRQRIAVALIAEQELALVVGAPQFVGALAGGQSCALRPTPHPAAALDQTVAIKHGMNGAFGRDGNTGEAPQQAFLDLSSAPAGVLALHVQNEVLDLKGKLVGVAIGTTTPIVQPLDPTLLVAIENLVARLAGNAKLPAKFRHRFAG